MIDDYGQDRSRPVLGFSYEWLEYPLPDDAKAGYLASQTQALYGYMQRLDLYLIEHPHDQEWVDRYKKLLTENLAYISARASGQKPSYVPSTKQPPALDGQMPRVFGSEPQDCSDADTDYGDNYVESADDEFFGDYD